MSDDAELVREALASLPRPFSEREKIYRAFDRLTARMDAEKGPKWRHLKRGTVYTEVGRGELQMARDLVDGATLVSYRGEDGRLWFREEGEFEDGRFEPLPTPPETGNG